MISSHLLLIKQKAYILGQLITQYFLTMNKLLITLTASLLFLMVACSPEAEVEQEVTAYPDIEQIFFGEVFTPENVVPAHTIVSGLTEEPSEVLQVSGVVVEVCQSKGCWLALELEGDETMRMTFLDYEFFVPKDLAGTEVIAKGEAWLNTTSVDALRHYAEDAQQSEEEIAAITSEKVEFYFEASGVLIQ